jgi:integrase
MAKVNVRKRGKKWEWRFEGAIVDGKRQQPSKGGYLTQREAMEAGTKAYAEYLNSGIVVQDKEMSVSDFLKEWLNDDILPNKAYGTFRATQSCVKNHLDPLLGKYKLVSVNSEVIQRYLVEMKSKGYSKQTIQQFYSMANQAFKYAVKVKKYIKRNPMNDVIVPKNLKAGAKREALEDDLWDQILELFPEGHRARVPLIIGYHTGMRISEVCALTWSDVDFGNDTIAITKQMCKKKGIPDWYYIPTKTDCSVATIKMGQTLREVLWEEKQRQEANEKELGMLWQIYRTQHEVGDNGDDIVRIIPYSKYVDSDLPRVYPICVNECGHYTKAECLVRASDKIRKTLKIQFSFHGLRHTHGTILAEEGINPKAIQQRLRHASIVTTMNTYVHATDELQNQAITGFEHRVRGQKISGGQTVDNQA